MPENEKPEPLPATAAEKPKPKAAAPEPVPDAPTCSGCGEPEGQVMLERCSVCFKEFCRDCAYRAYGGRKFCSEACGRAYFFHGEDDDDPDYRTDD